MRLSGKQLDEIVKKIKLEEPKLRNKALKHAKELETFRKAKNRLALTLFNAYFQGYNFDNVQAKLNDLKSNGEGRNFDEVIDLIDIVKNTTKREGLRALITDLKKQSEGRDDWEVLVEWVNTDKYKEGDYSIRYITIQYLRMLCGKDTCKPDKRVVDTLRNLGIDLGDKDEFYGKTIVSIMEQIKERTEKKSMAYLDALFWLWDRD
jgi:hypothetical protein